MNDNNLEYLIPLAAKEHQLPESLIAAIIQIESGGNCYAMRFEPAFLDRYVKAKPKVYGAVSRETERIALSTSWGLMQVMGLTARELGFAQTFLSQLCDPAVGIEYGCRYLSKQRDRYHDKYGWDGIIAAYNAGSVRRHPEGTYYNQSYVDKVARLWAIV